MSALTLVLGTRRLRREIEAQRQQLQLDRQTEKLARTQLRTAFMQRAISPTGLLSTVAVGFAAGKIGAGPANLTRTVVEALTSATALAITAARSAGIQMVLPMAVEWLQTKFQHQNDQEADTEAQQL